MLCNTPYNLLKAFGLQSLKKTGFEGLGARIIDRLSADLKEAFPDMDGFSPRNLKYMRKFAEDWADPAIVQQPVAQLQWRSILMLLTKIKDHAAREWYGKNRTVVEYSLAGYTNPIGVADWQSWLTENLPDDMKSSLPTIEEIEREIEYAEAQMAIRASADDESEEV